VTGVPNTLSKSVGLCPASFKSVRNLGCQFWVVYAERFRT
jgi:hypothetical protein